MLDEMPVDQELQMSTKEPEFGVTAIPLRINFSDPVSNSLGFSKIC